MPILQAASLAVLSACATMGCDVDAQDRGASARGAVGERSADNTAAKPVAPVTRDEVLEPREGSTKFEPSDYVATEGPFRLFGIEDNGETKAAIIADARTWSTRSYEEGESVGRGMKIVRISDDGIALHGARGEVVMKPGIDVELRLVRHRLDVVAKPLGKNRFALDTNAARAARVAIPTFETVEIFNGSMLKLGAIPPGSLLAEADFHEGDLVASVDGVPANEGSLEEIGRALTDGRPSVAVKIYRGGVPLDRTFSTAQR